MQAKEIIFYPRSYNKRGEASLHSAVGMTHDGQIINVKLRVDDKYLDNPNAPSIAELSRTDRKAKHPCIASDDNSAENREGVLLFSNCVYDGKNKAGIESYVSTWATVLAEDCDSPDPIISTGRIDYIKSSKVIAESKNAIKYGDLSDEDYEFHSERIHNPANYSFSALIYEKSNVVTENDFESFVEKAARIIESNHDGGQIGGVAVAWTDADGEVQSGEVFKKYNRQKNSFFPADEAVKEFVARNNPLLHGDVVFMPCYRIRCGRMGNDFYGSETQFPIVESTYFKDEEPRLVSVVVRVTEYDGGEMKLLSRMFPVAYDGQTLSDLLLPEADEVDDIDDTKRLLESVSKPSGVLNEGDTDSGDSTDSKHLDDIELPGTSSDAESSASNDEELKLDDAGDRPPAEKEPDQPEADNKPLQGMAAILQRRKAKS